MSSISLDRTRRVELMCDFTIPPGRSNSVGKALIRAEANGFHIDKEDLETAYILAYDGTIDVSEVDRQLKFFDDDIQYASLCETAIRGSEFNTIWELHGGTRARNWLQKLRSQMTLNELRNHHEQ